MTLACTCVRCEPTACDLPHSTTHPSPGPTGWALLSSWVTFPGASTADQPCLPLRSEYGQAIPFLFKTKSSPEDMLIDLRQRGRERETHTYTSMWDRNTGGLPPPMCTLAGDWTRSRFGVGEGAPTNWATGQGKPVHPLMLLDIDKYPWGGGGGEGKNLRPGWEPLL